MMTISCAVCSENVSKYKCSACFSPYCSISCWKKHKSEDNCKITEKPQKQSFSNLDKKKYFTDDTVREEKLNELGNSQNLKNILNNRYLQSTLLAVENASNPEEALKEAMKDPEFVEFVDECLKIVEDPDD